MSRRRAAGRFSAVAFVAIAVVPTTGTALAADRIRITTDVSWIHPGITSIGADEKGYDPIASEVAADLARQLLWTTDQQTQFMGLSQTFECVQDEGAKRTTSETIRDELRPTHQIHARLVPNSLRPEAVEVWLENVDGSSSEAPLRTALKGRDASVVFGECVLELVQRTARGSKPAFQRDILREFGSLPLSAHFHIASSRILRLIGRRFGPAVESEFLRRAEFELSQSARPRVAATANNAFRVLEASELLYRQYNFSQPRDHRIADLIPTLEALKSKSGREFPQVYMWLALAFQTRDGATPATLDLLKRAAEESKGYESPLFNLAFDDSEGAIPYLMRAISINPCSLRSRALLAQKQWPEHELPSRDPFQEVLSVRDYPLALYYKTVAILDARPQSTENLNAALELVNQLVAKKDFYSDDAVALKLLILMRAGNLDEADRTLAGANLVASSSYPRTLASVHQVNELVASMKSPSRRLAERAYRDFKEYLGGLGRAEPRDLAVAALLAARAGKTVEALDLAAELRALPDAPSTVDSVAISASIARIYELTGYREQARTLVGSPDELMTRVSDFAPY